MIFDIHKSPVLFFSRFLFLTCFLNSAYYLLIAESFQLFRRFYVLHDLFGDDPDGFLEFLLILFEKCDPESRGGREK